MIFHFSILIQGNMSHSIDENWIVNDKPRFFLGLSDDRLFQGFTEFNYPAWNTPLASSRLILSLLKQNLAITH